MWFSCFDSFVNSNPQLHSSIDAKVVFTQSENGKSEISKTFHMCGSCCWYCGTNTKGISIMLKQTWYQEWEGSAHIFLSTLTSLEAHQLSWKIICCQLNFPPLLSFLKKYSKKYSPIAFLFLCWWPILLNFYVHLPPKAAPLLLSSSWTDILHCNSLNGSQFFNPAYNFHLSFLGMARGSWRSNEFIWEAPEAWDGVLSLRSRFRDGADYHFLCKLWYIIYHICIKLNCIKNGFWFQIQCAS